MRRSRVTAISLSLALMTAGCGQSIGDAERSSRPSRNTTPTLASHDPAPSSVGSSAAVEGRPPPGRKTFPGTRKEQNEAMVDCLHEQGVAATVGPPGEGGFGAHAAPGQDIEALIDVCLARVGKPLKPALTPVRVKAHYRWEKKVVACLHRHGYETSPMPSLDRYLQQYLHYTSGMKTWIAYDLVPELPPEQMRKLNLACPQSEQDAREWGVTLP